MKVLLINDQLGAGGGAERMVHATRLVLEEAGHSVSTYAPPPSGMKLGRVCSLKHARAVRRRIRDFRPEIVHAHNVYRAVSPTVLLAAAGCRVPVVMSLHDYQIICPMTSLVTAGRRPCETGFSARCFLGGCYPRKTFNRTYQVLKSLKHAVHRAMIRPSVQHFLSPSTALMEWVERTLRVRNISLLPYFVEEEGDPAPEVFCPNLLFVGLLAEQKGVETLIRAVARALPVVPDLRLVIVGEGPEGQRFRQIAADLRVSGSVEFTGHLARVEVLRHFDRAACVVIPSIYAENSPLVALEAVSRGKVVIAADIGGLPELLDDGETGYLVRPNDVEDLSSRICSLFRDPGRLCAMSARVRARRQQRHTRRAYYETLVSAYERTIREAGRRDDQCR